MRYALRVDANQSQVISALEGAGAKVLVIGQPVDLLVGLPDGKKFAFFEVKNGSKPPSARKKNKGAGSILCNVPWLPDLSS